MNKSMLKTVVKMGVGFVAVGFCTAPAIAAERAAGQALEMQIQESGPAQTVIFRYCPAGTLRPGKPEATDKDGAPAAGGGASALPSTVEKMRPFYISEAEITFPQFKQVVDGQTFAALLARVERPPNDPDLVAAVKAGNELPVFAITAEEAITFCQQLSERFKKRIKAAEDAATLEEPRCRLPSHNEWQYACRAQIAPDALSPLPHFNRWPESYEVLDKAVRQTCLDEWRELGKAEADFRGTQEQVIAMMQRQSQQNSKPLEILAAFLKAGLGLPRNYAVNLPGRLSPGRSTPANAWNIYDMHENLREWVIVASDQEVFRFWEKVTAKSVDAEARQNKLLFLAGGAFNDLMTGKDSASLWQKFTIWGGHPLDLPSGSPRPFSLGDATADDMAFDQDPGLRVVLERVLRNDWLLLVRRLAVKGDLAQLRQQNPFDRYRAQVPDLVVEEEIPKVSAQITFYESLAAYRGGQKDVARKKLAEAKPHLLPEKKGSKATGLANLFEDSSPTPKPGDEKPSEDAVFFNQLEQRLLSAEAPSAF